MTPLLKDLYTASATATGGRDGRSTSSDGILDVAIATPVELGGPGAATNPEQLFAAGYAACFHSALKFAALGDRVDIRDSEVSASVGIGVLASGGFGLTVELDVYLPSLDASAARALVDRAHATCPYSNATRGNIDVALSLVA